jgi:probable rRNA maturation factor
MTRPELTLCLQWPDSQHRKLIPRWKIARWVRAALLQAPAEITVRIVGTSEARRLNSEFRAKDYATNVLTFDYQTEPVVIADVVLCADVVQAEALAQNLSLEAHYAHLLVHGVLHAQGFDHEDDADAQAMQTQETEVLAGLGFGNPYGFITPINAEQ